MAKGSWTNYHWGGSGPHSSEAAAGLQAGPEFSQVIGYLDAIKTKMDIPQKV